MRPQFSIAPENINVSFMFAGMKMTNNYHQQNQEQRPCLVWAEDKGSQNNFRKTIATLLPPTYYTYNTNELLFNT